MTEIYELSNGLQVRVYERPDDYPTILLADEEGIIELSPNQVLELRDLLNEYYDDDGK